MYGCDAKTQALANSISCHVDHPSCRLTHPTETAADGPDRQPPATESHDLKAHESRSAELWRDRSPLETYEVEDGPLE